jgi:succinyl-diaminopimelate desuccinylase
MKPLDHDEKALIEPIDQAAMLAQTERWSAINSGTGNLDGLARQAKELADAFAALPGDVSLRQPAPVVAVDAAGREVERAHGGHFVLSVRPQAERRFLLTGHMDTVYPPDDPFQSGTWRDADTLNAPGATDMKGGLAVMIELARWAAGADLAYDLALLFFPREELGPQHNPLPGVFDAAPLIDEAALVICLEPTDNTLQLGCLGNLNARVVFEGVSAHSARPWQGVNAVKVAMEGLREILELEPRDAIVDGLLFREVLSVTQIHGGVATNVIPARVECTLNFRYAPDRTPADAEARVRELVGRDVEITQNSPAAHVARRDGLVEALRRVGDFEVQPKQAWTNVADFAARGLDAVNFGPGATRYAHAVDEQVEIAALGRCFDALQRFLLGGS